MNKNNQHFMMFCVLMIMSGIAALTYQVVWVRLLSFTFGSTSASISTVISVFFFGLALGSYLSKRICIHKQSVICWYFILEAIIALSALILLPVLLQLDEFISLLPSLFQFSLVKFLLCLILLVIPTTAIGITFPLIVSYFSKLEQEKSCPTSLLYSVNTFGAVGGALLSGFLFIPKLGLDGAIYVAISLNIAIFLLGLIYFKSEIKINHLFVPFRQTSELEKLPRPSLFSPVTLLLVVSGFITLSLEIVLTKYLTIFTGTTVFGFAAILATFLFGISLGAWLISRYIQIATDLNRWAVRLLLGLVATLFLTKSELIFLPYIFEGINAVSVDGFYIQLLKYLVVFFMVLPTTVILGCLFPIGLRLYCRNNEELPQLVGRAYAINTLAGIAGALISGFYIIPTYSSETLFTVLFIVSISATLFLSVSLIEKQRSGLITGTISLALAVFVFSVPLNYKHLIDSVDYRFGYHVPDKTPEFLYLSEGKNAVISLISYDGIHARLQTNGLSESMLYIKEPEKALLSESLLAYLPYFLTNEPNSAFVIGYGGGITTRAYTHTNAKNIHVVELEENIIDAVQQIKNGPAEALKDPRVSLSIDDARHVLLTQEQSYDMISSQPSHPWTVGAANVFTQEFFKIVSSRLNPNGISAQWINLFRMDKTTLKAILKSYYTVFPYGFTLSYIETGDLILIGSKNPIEFDFQKINQRINKSIRWVLSEYHIESAIDLTQLFALSRKQIMALTKDSIANNDLNILSEIRLSGIFEPPAAVENPKRFLNQNMKFQIVDYLQPEKRAELLYNAGLKFITTNKPIRANQVVSVLNSIDNSLALQLQYLIYCDTLAYEKATELYIKMPQKTDIIHAQQAEIFLHTGKLKESQQTLRFVQDNNLEEETRAKLLYLQNAWQELSKQTFVSQNAKAWQQLAISRTDVKQAGKALYGLSGWQQLKQLDFYGLALNYATLEKKNRDIPVWLKAINDITNLQKTKFTKLLNQAIRRQDAVVAQRLFNELRKYTSEKTVIRQFELLISEIR